MKLRLFRLASVLAPFVPRRLGCLVAGLIGALAYYLAPGTRHTVEANMRQVLGSSAAFAKVRWATRGVFANAAKNYFDLFRLPKLNMGQFRELVQSQGLEHLWAAYNRGQGVIVITAHLGNFDVCGQEIVAQSLDMLVLVEPLQPPALFDLVTGLRQSKGVKWVPVGPSALKEVVRFLKRGGIVGIACDRDIQKAGIEVPFFGAMASMPQGAAYLALRTGALVLPAFGERLPDDKFLIYVEPPLEAVRTGDFEADLRATMDKMVAVLEKHIGARPNQWVVFERRWPDPCRDQAS